jgi:hypothetical protein
MSKRPVLYALLALGIIMLSVGGIALLQLS